MIRDTVKDTIDWVTVGGVNGAAIGITFAHLESWLTVLSLGAAITYTIVRLIFLFKDRRNKLNKNKRNEST